MSDFVTRDEMEAHLEAANQRSCNNAIKIGTALIKTALVQHTKACPHGVKLSNHLAKIAGIVAGISVCSSLIGFFLAIILKHVWS